MARKLQYKSLDLPPTSDIINTSSMCRTPRSFRALPESIGTINFINSLNSRIIILVTDNTLYKYDRVENTITTLLQTVGSYQIYSVYVIDSNIYYTTANGSSTCDVYYFNIASRENRLIGTIPYNPAIYRLLQLWNGTLYLVPMNNSNLYQVNTNTLTSIGLINLPGAMDFLCSSTGFLIYTGGTALALAEIGWFSIPTYTLTLPDISRSMTLGADGYLYVVQSTIGPDTISLLKIELSSTPAIVDTISLTYTGGFVNIRAVRSYGKYVLVFLSTDRVCIYDTTLDTSFETNTGHTNPVKVIILDNQDLFILRPSTPEIVFPGISQINDAVLRPWQYSQNFNI